MCLNCLLAVFNGQKAYPVSKKDRYVTKLSEMQPKTDENSSKEINHSSKKMFPVTNSHLISDEFTVLKVPGIASPRNKMNVLNQT